MTSKKELPDNKDVKQPQKWLIKEADGTLSITTLVVPWESREDNDFFVSMDGHTVICEVPAWMPTIDEIVETYPPWTCNDGDYVKYFYDWLLQRIAETV